MGNVLKILAALFIARRFPRLFQAGMAYQAVKHGVRRL